MEGKSRLAAVCNSHKQVVREILRKNYTESKQFFEAGIGFPVVNRYLTPHPTRALFHQIWVLCFVEQNRIIFHHDSRCVSSFITIQNDATRTCRFTTGIQIKISPLCVILFLQFSGKLILR
jgi:hypothetical protein